MAEKIVSFQEALIFAKKNNLKEFGFDFIILLSEPTDKNNEPAFCTTKATLRDNHFWCDVDGEFKAISAEYAIVTIS